MVSTNVLPGNFLVRTPTMDDLEAVFELIHVSDLADDGIPDHTLDELRFYWQAPEFNLATDAWSVVTPEGKLIGYADTEYEGYGKMLSFIRVLPEFRQHGFEAHLLQLIQKRALQRLPEVPKGTRVVLYNWFSSADKTMGPVLEQEGFKYARSFWRMEKVMDKAPQPPELPAGITLRTLVVGKEERAVFEMLEEAFQDHWGHTPTNFEEWIRWRVDAESFDPTLWFLAFAGDELVGGNVCRYERDLDLGWVGQIGVLRPWRRKGLAMALLLHSFGEFYRRGIDKVGLGVDAQNLTGATRLYERAGMHVALQHDTYEKELRPGEEPGTSLATI